MKKGDFVKINYVGRLESGEIFDLTKEDVAKKEKVYSEKISYKPITVIVGAGFLIPGLDKVLEDMKVGEKRDIEVSPEEGFGQRNSQLVKIVSKKEFSGQVEPKAGMIVDFSGMKGRIQSVDAGRVTVDFNNPLAGKKLKYEIEIIEEIKDDKEKISGVIEFFTGKPGEVEIKEKEAIVKNKIPDFLKERISAIVLNYIQSLDSLSFLETYKRK